MIFYKNGRKSSFISFHYNGTIIKCDRTNSRMDRPTNIKMDGQTDLTIMPLHYIKSSQMVKFACTK